MAFYIGNGILKAGSVEISEGMSIPAGFLSKAEEDGLRERGLVGDTPPKPRAAFGQEVGKKAEPEKPKKSPFPTSWAFPLEAITSKSLAELNIMIADHASRLKVATPELFETLEEAAAFLQKDKK